MQGLIILWNVVIKDESKYAFRKYNIIFRFKEAASNEARGSTSIFVSRMTRQKAFAMIFKK